MKPYYKTDLCECGCKEVPRLGNRFVNGHNSRLEKSKSHRIKIGLAQKKAWATKRIKPEVTYKGKFCRCCRNTCALILIYDRTDEIFDVLAGAYNNFDSPECWQAAAKEFVDQLKERWSISFMEALRSEIDEIIKEYPK